MLSFVFFFFFFSSRRRHTRWPRDWSSDVCSSDLYLKCAHQLFEHVYVYQQLHLHAHLNTIPLLTFHLLFLRGNPQRRSEERRVGKECRSRRAPCDEKKKKEK